MTTQDKIDILEGYINTRITFCYEYNTPVEEDTKYNNAKQWLAELEQEDKGYIILSPTLKINQNPNLQSEQEWH